MTEYKMVKPSELKDDMTIIDVRTPAEHQSQHLLRDHDNVPLDQLNPKNFAEAHKLNPESNIYILCRSGTRAKTAADKFIAEGYNNVHVIDGGIMACETDGHDIFCADTISVKGFNFGALSLDRQVRVIAGAMVVAGVLLGGFIGSAFYLISLFVGAGLIYAGITDTCGLATVLSRAPWNQAIPATNTCSIKKPSETEPKTCSLKPKGE